MNPCSLWKEKLVGFSICANKEHSISNNVVGKKIMEKFHYFGMSHLLGRNHLEFYWKAIVEV